MNRTSLFSLPAPRTLAWGIATLLVLTACGRNAGSEKGKAPSGIPVVVAPAERKDVPIRIEGVGNVEAISSVALKSRIDGQIVRVAIRDGADVARGQVLFEIDPRPAAAQLKQAQARLAGDLAQAERAKEQDKRYQDLLQKRFISPDAYQQIRANLDSALATADASRAAVDNARLQLEFATLRAPIAGRAGRVQIQIGNMVKANDVQPLVTLNQIAPIYVSFAVPEKFIGQVRAAMRDGNCAVDITTRNSAGEPVQTQGTLSFVDNAVDSATGTVKLRATVANRDTLLWPGQFVTASATLGKQAGAIVVPADAVQNGPSGTYVYVVDKATAKMKPVKVGRTLDRQSVIEEGLKGDEQVVVDGQSRLLPGVPVVIQKPAP